MFRLHICFIISFSTNWIIKFQPRFYNKKAMCGILCEILNSDNSLLKDEKILQRIKNRGPDCCNIQKLAVGNITLTFCGAVLWMSGKEMVPQPLEDENGILLYNGDIFDETWDMDTNDTKIIFEKFSAQHNSNLDIVQEIRKLKGPFSIIYYDKVTQDLYFTRDRLGRNSLLFHKNEYGIVISSTLGRNYKCIEIPATYVYTLNLKTNVITLCPWSDGNSEEYTVDSWLEIVQTQQSRPDEEFSFEFRNDNLTKDEIVSYIESIAKESKNDLMLLDKLSEHHLISEVIIKITEFLEKSMKMRLFTQPLMCKVCIKNNERNCHDCTVGILFSGGLDCTILAYLSDKYFRKDQSIELINVAFNKDDNQNYDVPDRLTGRQSFQELKRLCPERNWVFKEVNVPKEELEQYQRSAIADLVYPRQTILDESLGSALWFASRGQNECSSSSCRVLLLGSGADELFGGYTRHRNAFRRQGWSGLDKELQLDWKRISFRNLARDNRVICDHGRQPRMPYLDEDFSNYVVNLKPWLRCFPSEDLRQGVGDKLMLRLVAYNLGLKEVVTFPKRALQFGSRIANKKEKGSNISKSFLKINT